VFIRRISIVISFLATLALAGCSSGVPSSASNFIDAATASPSPAAESTDAATETGEVLAENVPAPHADNPSPNDGGTTSNQPPTNSGSTNNDGGTTSNQPPTNSGSTNNDGGTTSNQPPTNSGSTNDDNDDGLPLFGSPTLLRDINNSVAVNDESYSKSHVTLANGNVLFIAMNYQSGEELWVTDGTQPGTFALDAVNPNSTSFPSGIQINAARTAVAFNCSSESAGPGICVSDGTFAGTRRLAGEFVSAAANVKLCGARTFATGTFGTNGGALVSSDGTSALALAASYTTMGATGISQPTCVGSRLYFATSGSSTGAELWTSDGSSSGTYLVRELYAGAISGLSSILGSLGNKVLLQAKTSTYTGNELWMYDPDAVDCTAFDGTTSTCVAATNGTGYIGMVKDIYTGGTNGANSGVAHANGQVMNGKLYFQGTNTASNSELWYTDGTTAGTAVVYDFAGTTGAPDLSKATVYAAGGTSRLYYSTNRGSDGYGSEPHMLALDSTGGCATYGADFRTPTNGGGCVGMISDMISGSSGYIVTFYGANANGAYFKGNPGTTYYHWNNTTSAPVAFTSTVAPDSGAAVTASGLLYSTQSSPAGVVGGKRELWFTDGTTPVLLKEINAEAGSIGTNNSGTSSADAQIGTRRYFSAWDETNGVELWVTDGTAGGTRLVKDINGGTGNSTPANLVVMSGVLFFQATNGSLGAELWAYDPAAADCSRFDPATSYATSCDTADNVNLPGKIGIVKDINAGATGSNVSQLSLVDGRLYFVATTAAEGTEPYVSDGTASGTILLQNLATGAGSSTGSKFAKAGSAVVFQATNGSGQNDLFAFIPGPEVNDSACTTSRGAGFVKANAAGCYKLLYDFTSTSPAITVLGSSSDGAKVFFRATEAASGAELWVTDGSTTGTALVLDIFPGAGGSASVITGGTAGPFGSDKFVFAAIDSYTANGVPSQQIWISDGTAGGTAPISALATGYHAKGLVVDSVGQRIFFIGGSAAHGMELWKSDGTLAGTQMVDDFCPGACNGAITAVDLNITFGLTSLEDGRVIYRGNDGSSGSEPVVSDGTADGTYRIDLAPGSASSSPIRFLPVSDGSAVTKIVIFATNGVTGFEPWVVTQ
jgi:ELWxxDGT repeat protein